MLRDTIALYTELSGNDGENTPIVIIGAYLDGYDKGREDAKRVFQPMCRHFGKCMSHPEVSREYYDYCSLYREDCKCQCLWRQEEE